MRFPFPPKRDAEHPPETIRNVLYQVVDNVLPVVRARVDAASEVVEDNRRRAVNDPSVAAGGSYTTDLDKLHRAMDMQRACERLMLEMLRVVLVDGDE